MSDRSRTRRNVVHGTGLCRGQQVLERLHPERGVHDDHVGRPPEVSDVGELAQRIISGIGAGRRRGHVRTDARYQEGAAIRLRACHRRRPDQTTGTTSVLDEEVLAELVGELLGQQTAERVRRAARRERRDDTHGLGGPVGGAGNSDRARCDRCDGNSQRTQPTSHHQLRYHCPSRIRPQPMPDHSVSGRSRLPANQRGACIGRALRAVARLCVGRPSTARARPFRSCRAHREWRFCRRQAGHSTCCRPRGRSQA